jgi:hypothetical protein
LVRTTTGDRLAPREPPLAPLLILQLETARLQAAWAEQAIEEVEKWHTPAEPQDRASTLAALKAEIAAGAP